jgi:inorganic pyrophosphatase
VASEQAPTGGSEGVIEVVIEIPRGTRNKYEYDHKRHVICLDRRLFSSTVYPADYGFVPDTLAEDGDPLDVLVLLDEGTFPGCHIRVRPIGLFLMRDEHGPDAKVVSVPASDPLWGSIRDIVDMPRHVANEIAHFFAVYKDLEPGKETEIEGFRGVAEAWEEIRRSRERARAAG